MFSTPTTAEPFDYLILGQGIAGSTLAWQLISQGAKVGVIDAGKPTTASSIAAGLLTPITGKRLTVSERWDELFPIAEQFYQSVEQQTGSKLLTKKPSLRIFANQEERELFERRCEEESFAKHVRLIDPIPDGLKGPLGGFEMLEAVRLDTAGYLNVTRDRLHERACYFQLTIDPHSDVVLGADAVVIPKLGIIAKRMIFCQGAVSVMPTWLTELQLKPSLGEVLSIELPIDSKQTVHQGIWLVPEGSGSYRLGATNRWDRFDEGPTEAGKQELLAKLTKLTEAKPELLSHQAAIRPTTVDRKVSFGWSVEEPRLGWLNGLGTKGSLWAPWSSLQMLKNHFK